MLNFVINMSKKLTPEQKGEPEKIKPKELLETIDQENKKLEDLKKDIVYTEDPEEKQQLEEYAGILQEKINHILEAITKEKMSKANLDQLSKAFRVFTERMDQAQKNAERNKPKLNVHVNLNTQDLSKEELLEVLAKKSSENSGNNK